MLSRIACFHIPVFIQRFHEEPPIKADESKVANPVSADSPKSPAAPGSQEPKTPEQIIDEFRSLSPKAYDIVFGRGVTKGAAETKGKKLPLDDDQVKAAQKLFEQVDVSEVSKLLEAKKLAEETALAKAKAEKDFNDFSARVEAAHKEELGRINKVAQTQISALKEQVVVLENANQHLRMVLTDIKITKELVSAGKAKGFIDPSDAVAQLGAKLSLNNDLEIVERGSDKPADIEKLLEKLVTDKPHLVGSTQRPGQGSSSSTVPVVPSSKKNTYKRSQLRDSTFYKANEADILLAVRENRIVDDINK